jgi:uncharacterized protein YbbK (DUF523 family)
MLIVSACLAGKPCRYDGEGKPNDEIVALYERGEAVLVCPEEMGGLTTPRVPSEIALGTGEDVLNGNARVITKDGRDVTKEFMLGAQETLCTARSCGAKLAILKAKSPSCGCGMIYDGTFSGKLHEGDGVTAALLKRNGVEVETR